MSEPLTLYKLIVLYMLTRVNFPLTNSQISNFVLDAGYTTYFTLQQTFSELIESSLIRSETIRNSSYYYITDAGKETLGYFEHMISKSIQKDIDDYLKKHRDVYKRQEQFKFLQCQCHWFVLYFHDMLRGADV